jgi:protein TonB
VPAPRGRAPKPVMHRIFVPPTKPPIENPRLPLQMAMLEEPGFNVAALNMGDPFSRYTTGDQGRGGLLRRGDGDGPGMGDNQGPGRGGRISSSRMKPWITRGPEVIYNPEPEYSAEARKVRFQGTVVLPVEIGTERPHVPHTRDTRSRPGSG